MIEDIAIRMTGLSDPILKLIFYCFLIVGAVISAVSGRGKSELQRAPFFFLLMVMAFIYVVIGSVWLLIVPAFLGGYLWLLLAVDLLAAILWGFGVGKAAMARSRDAYGDNRHALLAFIPLANLVLLLKPSRSEASLERAATALPVMTGGLGVFFGLVLLVSTPLLSRTLVREMQGRIERMSTDPATEQRGLEFMIRAHGVDAILKQIAARARTPATIDAATRLERIQADGSLLRRSYVITFAGSALTDHMRSTVNRNICVTPLFIALLRCGASVREEYARPDGSEIGSQTVTWSICAATAG